VQVALYRFLLARGKLLQHCMQGCVLAGCSIPAHSLLLALEMLVGSELGRLECHAAKTPLHVARFGSRGWFWWLETGFQATVKCYF